MLRLILAIVAAWMLLVGSGCNASAMFKDGKFRGAYQPGIGIRTDTWLLLNAAQDNLVEIVADVEGEAETAPKNDGE